MPRVPITVMGYRCERCGHEWIPRGGNLEQEPTVCAKCRSPYWNRPRKKATSMLTYEDFRDQIHATLKHSGPLTWTEIRTVAKLPEKFPNNKWVHRMEQDIGLKRHKDSQGIIKWKV
jgi:DNA-directed RNA polymerase subunit RPC12/RpoP